MQESENKKYSIKFISELINAKVEGNLDLEVVKISAIEDADAGSITFLATSKFNKYVNADGLRSVAISKEIPFKTWKVEDKYLCSIIDYKNISLLQKYVTETNKIITSKISNVSLGKQKKLAREIKKAKMLGIL